MSTHRHQTEPSAGAADQSDPLSYEWMWTLPNLGWAWEFLRRDEDYRAEYSAYREGGMATDRSVAAKSFAGCLLRPVDPEQDARSADVFWHKDVCATVLPVESVPVHMKETSQHLPLNGMRCRVTVIDDKDTHHVLYSEDGRSLQLEVHGPLTEASLLTPALLQEQEAPGRLIAMRRLCDMMATHELRPSLYPPERRAARLLALVKALDGSLLKLSQRDIAIRLFGAARVAREWADPGNHMRDQVRRTIRSGRKMMAGGYRRLLD
jgi:hypothetical protein